MTATATFGRRDQRAKPGVVPAQAQPIPFPFDPVLRMALIDKGVITSDDLAAAERKIAATTGQIIKEMGDGQG